MDVWEYQERIAALEKENRILKQKLVRSQENRAMLEEVLETHLHTLKMRNAELEESQKQIRQSATKYRLLAFHDALTGLPNRIMFLERLTKAIVRSANHHHHTVVFFVDLDHFKPINDNWGHEVGDSVLRKVAGRLQACVRVNDVVARIGGDEFAILMTELQELRYAEAMAERILMMIAKPIQLQELTCTVGASIGISSCPLDGHDGSMLLQNADTAMYSIKKTGRNGYRFYHELSSLSKEG